MPNFQHILVTGGAGFIGSAFVDHLLCERPGVRVTTFDLLTYAGNMENLASAMENGRHRFMKGDIALPEQVAPAFSEGVDAVVHFAAESHVDRSIEDASHFLRTNVLGTQVLLDAARAAGVRRFLQVSTDEVYGSLGPTGAFTEDSPLDPSSPYSASKASADLLALACHRTHGIDVVVTRCSNNYGPRQFPEKLIPLTIANALADQPLPVYGDGRQVRDWIHVKDHSDALLTVLEKGTPGRVYNIGGGNERANLDIVRTLLRLLDKPDSLIRYVTDRPGHDRRYAVDITRIRTELGWQPRTAFDEGLAATLQWYKDHSPWLDHIRSGTYRDYYDRMYGWRENSPEAG